MVRQEFKMKSSSTIKRYKLTKQSLVAYAILSFVFVNVLLSLFQQQSSFVDAKLKKKETKKLAKSLVKNLVYRKLTTQHRILPLPIPLPVPIEINEPPVYINGPPKYVTIYKRLPAPPPTTQAPQPVIQPIIHKSYISYNLPKDDDRYTRKPEIMYVMAKPPSSYMTSSPEKYSYSSMYDDDYYKEQSFNNKRSKFSDFDDNLSNYYVEAPNAKSSKNMKEDVSSSSMERSDEQGLAHKHIISKRQAGGYPMLGGYQPAYQSSYSQEEPCHGLPLDINIRSRIKPENLFIIRGNSKVSKCMPLSPPPLQLPPHTNIKLNWRPPTDYQKPQTQYYTNV